MTPKEKARELVNIYTMVIYPILNINKSKECALIAVDEMIEAFWYTHKNESEYRYWLEVKKEIELL